jgi:hypothetical protein
MSTKAKTEIDLIGSVGGLRSDSGGRAERPAGGAPSLAVGLPREVRDRLSDDVIDGLLAGARTEEEIVSRGGMVLAQLTKRLVDAPVGRGDAWAGVSPCSRAERDSRLANHAEHTTGAAAPLRALCRTCNPRRRSERTRSQTCGPR